MKKNQIKLSMCEAGEILAYSNTIEAEIFATTEKLNKIVEKNIKNKDKVNSNLEQIYFILTMMGKYLIYDEMQKKLVDAFDNIKNKVSRNQLNKYKKDILEHSENFEHSIMDLYSKLDSDEKKFLEEIIEKRMKNLAFLRERFSEAIDSKC